MRCGIPAELNSAHQQRQRPAETVPSSDSTQQRQHPAVTAPSKDAARRGSSAKTFARLQQSNWDLYQCSACAVEPTALFFWHADFPAGCYHTTAAEEIHSVGETVTGAKPTQLGIFCTMMEKGKQWGGGEASSPSAWTSNKHPDITLR